MDPDVTVVIVNWNTRALVLDCIGALEQNAGTETACVVVDNGSTDGSADAIEREFSNVGLIRNEANFGFARANNIALAGLKTDFALLLNSDARIQPGALPAMLEYMKTNPTVGIVGARLLNEDGSIQNAFDNFPTLATELLNKSLLRRLFPARYAGKSLRITSPTEVESVIGACMLIRAAALEQTGLFDEDYFFFKEETDLCLQMRKVGWSVVHLPDAIAVHLQGQSKAIAPLAAKIEYDRSNIIFFRKHRGPGATLALRIGRIVKLFANLSLGGIGTLFTLGGNRKLLARTRVYAGLLLWHLRGCPAGPGLRRENAVDADG